MNLLPIYASTTITKYQKKSCFYLELDSEIQTKENTKKEEKEDIEEFIVDETLLKVSNQFV